MEINGNMYQRCENCSEQILYDRAVETPQGEACDECATQCTHCGEWVIEDELYDPGAGHDPICNDCHEAEMQKRHDAGVKVWYVGSRRYEEKRGGYYGK